MIMRNETVLYLDDLIKIPRMAKKSVNEVVMVYEAYVEGILKEYPGLKRNMVTIGMMALYRTKHHYGVSDPKFNYAVEKTLKNQNKIGD